MKESEYRFFDLGSSSRLALSGGLFALGAVSHILLPWGFAPGLAAIVAGYVPLALRKATNKPADKGLEEWRPVTMTEIDRIADSIRESKKARMKLLAADAGSFGIFILAVMIAAGLAAVGSRYAILALDAALFLVPALFFGRVKVFVPPELDFKMASFQAIFAEGSPDGIVVVPYLRFDKDAKGADIPEDMRIMVEPARKPDDLVGAQMQVATNKGPNGPVPYLYAVVITRGKKRSYQSVARMSWPGVEVEPGGDEEYGSVVLRQSTSNGGYRTTPDDCARLFRVVLDAVSGIA